MKNYDAIKDVEQREKIDYELMAMKINGNLKLVLKDNVNEVIERGASGEHIEHKSTKLYKIYLFYYANFFLL